MKKLLLPLFALLFFSACKKDNDEATGPQLQAHDQNEMMRVMHQMMSRMDTMQMSNDPEIDFSKMMRMHHQGAIEMANVELQKGTNDSLKRLAQKIITKQQQEIQEFNTLLATLAVDNMDMAFAMELMETMEKGGGVADVQLITGDTDNDFATLMIVHHQEAIENSSAYLHHSNNTQLRAMAERMIDDQMEEIQELTNWIRANRR
ncbi:DUF305 domain-containing protein [Flaviaesturariibacter amylovorans]|uniref:DUF305 domain-containing protein n=1 Tax=Flaviaesturariibacter amylovorans TaxID=1084520 RepID=A0ABP8HKX5_9BACT